MMKKFNYKNIVEIKADSEVNQKIYKRLNSASQLFFQKAVNEEAQDYLHERAEIFSGELSEFLEKLGIDFQKENEYVHYQLDDNWVIEIWYDFIGEFKFLTSQKSDFYEANNFAVNIYFEENASHGKRKEFENLKTSRISLAIVKEQ